MKRKHVTNSGRATDIRVGTGLGWAVPSEVRVTETHVLYRWDMTPERRRPREPLLPRFVALADASPEVIGAFARTWGALAEAGPLAGLAPYAVGEQKARALEQLYPAALAPGQADGLAWRDPGETLWYQEPLDVWRARAAAVAAVQRLALRLEAGGRGDPRDWEAIVRVTEEVTGRPRLPYWAGIGSRAPRNGRFLLSGVLTTWMRTSGLALRLEWAAPAARPALEILAGRSVWGGVVQALVIHLLGEGRPVKCAKPKCGRLVGKTVSGRRRAFCSRCRKKDGDPGVAYRVAQYRENKRRVRELHAEGHSLAEIAERMGFHDTEKRPAVKRVEQLLAGPSGTDGAFRRRNAPVRGK